MILLFGDGLQFSLLVILLGQLGQAHQGGIHLLDGQEAFRSSGEQFTVLKEHPHRLRHVALKSQESGVKLLKASVLGNTNHQ